MSNEVIGWWTMDGSGYIAEGQFDTKADAQEALNEGQACGDYDDDYSIAYGRLAGHHILERLPEPK